MSLGIVISYNHLEFTPTGDVETELLIGREMIEGLKKKIQGMEVEDILPIDFKPHTLKIFQGCKKGQGLKKDMKGLKEHLFLGSVSAPSATLRLDHPGPSRTSQREWESRRQQPWVGPPVLRSTIPGPPFKCLAVCTMNPSCRRGTIIILR